MQPNPHTRAILGETGIGAALPVEGNRGAMATPGEAVGKSHFLAKGVAPHPRLGTRRAQVPSLSKKGSLKSQGLRLVKGERESKCQGVSAGAGNPGAA